MWIVLSVIASIALLGFFGRGSNAVWGGATIGLLIGIGMVIFSKNFSWSEIYKPIVISVLVGLVFELPAVFSAASKE